MDNLHLEALNWRMEPPPALPRCSLHCCKQMDLSQSQTQEKAQQATFEEIFEKETRDLLGNRFRLSFSIGIVLYLLFSVLDLFFARDQWGEFFALRVAVAAIAGLAMGLSLTKWGERNVLPLSFFTLSVAAFVLSMMTSMLKGFSSEYFCGIMLVLYLVGLFMPWRLGITLTFCFVVVGGYFSSNLWLHNLELNAVLPFFFLLGTSALTTMGSMAVERSRRRDLEQRLALKDANEQLQELDQAKTNFFANVSHELRTPLMLILGPLEALLDGQHRNNLKPVLESMNMNANRLLRQVNMILNFAKLESGHQDCAFETANVGNILSNLIKGLDPAAESRAMRLEYSGIDELPNSVFDPEKIETILSNLLGNAVKFTPNGGRITVRAGSENGRLWVEVEDTGRGIPLKEQAKVFERFHQVPDSAKAAKIQGTGLGLSLSREFARMHDGDLTVKSREGAGSVFRMELPLEPSKAYHDASREVEVDEENIDAAQRFGSTSGSTSTKFADLAQPTLSQSQVQAETDVDENAPLILVVEDNDDMRAFISGSLSRKYRVETAEDGMAGLEAAHRLQPDLIISDVMMPRLDGFGMLKRLRESAAMHATPVILVTARTGANEIVQGLELGAIDYVTKPFRISELEARIETQLRMVRVQKQLDERETRLIAVGQMAGTIAHDLRSPLTSLGLRVDVLRMEAEKKGFEPSVGDDLNVMKRSLARASSMVNDLMEYLSGEKVHLNIEEVEVGPFLHDIADDLKPTLKPAGIAIKLEISDVEPLCVAMDRERMSRAVQNVIMNSYEAMTQFENACGDEIKVQAYGSRGNLVLRLADNGPGIPDEVAETLFKPFQTAGKPKGTGLGLSIVQNLVEAHGGTVAVENQPPEGGASFVIEIGKNTSFWEELASSLPDDSE